jgi:hypothetical protein
MSFGFHFWEFESLNWIIYGCFCLGVLGWISKYVLVASTVVCSRVANQSRVNFHGAGMYMLIICTKSHQRKVKVLVCVFQGFLKFINTYIL